MTARICAVHDPEDVIPGRICGGPHPCTEHPGGRSIQNRWRSTPAALRNHKPITLTLSPEARAKLLRLANGGSKSAVVERLLESAK
jgi:hypothetical protein